MYRRIFYRLVGQNQIITVLSLPDAQKVLDENPNFTGYLKECIVEERIIQTFGHHENYPYQGSGHNPESIPIGGANQ